MVLIPVNDKIKVHVSKDQFGINAGSGSEHGTVVAVPDNILYFGYHSFAFENSLGNDELMSKISDFYHNLIGKIVFWEALQDRGRRFQEGEDEFVFLNMSDVIAYEDGEETKAYLIEDIRNGGFSL